MPGRVSSQKFNPKAATPGSAFPVVRDIGSCSSYLHLEFPNNPQKPLQDRDGILPLQIRDIFMENWRLTFSWSLEMFLLGWEGLFPLLPISSIFQHLSPDGTWKPPQDLLPCSLQTLQLSPFPNPFWGQPARKLGIKTCPKPKKLPPEDLPGNKSLGQCSAAQKCQKKADLPKDPTLLQPPRKFWRVLSGFGGFR